jgi:hypothetical protein
MNRKLRLGIDNITQGLKDLTLPSARHTFVGLIALTFTMYLNAWVIALPFCLCIILHRTAPLLLLVFTPLVCALTVFILSLILSKNKPRESSDALFSRQACNMLKEIMDNGIAYSPPQSNRVEPRAQRNSRDDYNRSTNIYLGEQNPSNNCGVQEDTRCEKHRQSGYSDDTEYRRTVYSGTNTNYAAEAPKRAEDLRGSDPYNYYGDPLPSPEELQEFYRRNAGGRFTSEPDPRHCVRDIGHSRGDERITTSEREGFIDTAESAGRNSFRE